MNMRITYTTFIRVFGFDIFAIAIKTQLQLPWTHKVLTRASGGSIYLFIIYFLCTEQRDLEKAPSEFTI